MNSPIKISWKTEWLPLLAVIAAAILSIYFYQHLPERVATHWNFAGQVDGYSGRAFGAFGLPAILAGMYLLFLVLPFLDPHSDRYGNFSGVYQFIKDAILLAFLGIYILASLYNLGYDVKVNYLVPTLVGLLLIAIGNYMGKVKRNWFVGIRTPWTISSENVWNKTNRVGGFAMMIFGIVIIISPFLSKALSTVLFALSTIILVFGTIVYSYWLFLKEKKNNLPPTSI